MHLVVSRHAGPCCAGCPVQVLVGEVVAPAVGLTLPRIRRASSPQRDQLGVAPAPAAAYTPALPGQPAPFPGYS